MSITKGIAKKEEGANSRNSLLANAIKELIILTFLARVVKTI